MRHFLAVQSQDYPGASWAVAQRLEGGTAADVDRAFDAGDMIRTHVLRPTWHFVAPEDLRWLLALTGHRIQRGVTHRHRVLEIDSALVIRSARVFERAIAKAGPLTRQELREALAMAGIEAAAGRLTHLVMHAELDAVLCSGPRKGAAQTYALVDERIPPTAPKAHDEALAELADRYIASHGPAQDVDLAWWSGLSLGDARRGLAAASPSLDREAIDGRTFWFKGSAASMTATHPPGPTMHLLPNYDELLVAFSDRRDGLDPALPPAARVPLEILSHVMVRDGLVVGRWRRPTAAAHTVLRLEPRVDLDAGDRRRLRMAVDRYAAYLGRRIEVSGLD